MGTAAISLVVLFGYWSGTTIATIGFGYIIDFFGWQGGFVACIAVSGLPYKSKV